MQKYDYLRVYCPHYSKRRVGKNNDGGYIICDMDGEYDMFISGGIADDLSFELALLKIYPNLVCHAFDASIPNLPEKDVVLVPNEDQWIPIKDITDDWIQVGNLYRPFGMRHLGTYGAPIWSNSKESSEVRKYIGIMNPTFQLILNHETLTWFEARDKYPNLATANDVSIYHRVHFHKKFLGKTNVANISNLKEYFDKYSDIFLKLDIEGGENELFESFSDDDLKKIKQLVIEFHSHEQVNIPTRLLKTHWLVHLHVNNYVDTVTQENGVMLPEIFECTYVRKRDGDSLSLNKDPIPGPLDQPNLSAKPDITLTGYPYIDTISHTLWGPDEITHGFAMILSKLMELSETNKDILSLLKLLSHQKIE